MRLIVLGIDGAGFELIDPWLADGTLPNLAAIKMYGAYGDLISVLPPVTSPNWKAYSTGKNPGKLGIFWWENADWVNQRIHFPSERLGLNREIWDYMGEAGLTVGIAGMPTTYPPKKVNGFLIAGAEASEVNFTYPARLQEMITAEGWRNLPRLSVEVERGKASIEIHDIIEKQLSITEKLADEYKVDFLQTTIFPINIMQHYLWNADETKKGWQIIDMHLGKLMSQGCDIILMSDHGSNRIEYVFNINSWLVQQGYLKFNLGFTSILNTIGINQQNMMRLLTKLKMLSLVKKVVSKRIRHSLPDASEGIRRENKARKIDWKKSKALASGQGPVYINPCLSAEEINTIKDEITRKLESLVNPFTGQKVAEKVYTREEIYKGQYLSEAPDLVIDQAKGVHIPGGIGHKDIFVSPQRWQAENKRAGLFMAYGPTIKQGINIDSPSILDLAPTILHLLELPVPDDIDGRVIMELFRDSTTPAMTPPRTKPAGEIEAEKVKGKIQNLKKLGRI